MPESKVPVSIIMPDSPEEWVLELAAFNANRAGVPEDVRQTVQTLWAQFVAREAWLINRTPEDTSDKPTPD